MNGDKYLKKCNYNQGSGLVKRKITAWDTGKIFWAYELSNCHVVRADIDEC